jgi:hypothetical protein
MPRKSLKIHDAPVAQLDRAPGFEPDPDAPNGPTSPTSPPTQAVPSVDEIHITPAVGQLPAGGGSVEIIVETIALKPYAAAPRVSVALQASGGDLSASAVTTDATGHARVTWTGTTSATITAQAGSITAETALTVFVPPPTPPPSVRRRHPRRRFRPHRSLRHLRHRRPRRHLRRRWR